MVLIPTIGIDHLSETEKRAYTLADNKIAENADWDEDLLRVELKYLTSFAIDFDVDLTGFSPAETDLLLGSTEFPHEENLVPEPPEAEDEITRPGDIWLLGPHKVICGDCRDPEVIDRLMGDANADMVFTDPPYNVRVDGHISGLGQHKHREFAMASDELSSDC